MKKKLVASLAASMVFAVAGTSFAATNPFVDVPAKHWSYDSVTKLSQAGIVDGYADGKFYGDKVISRYEMAQIVAKAMAKAEKADASQKVIIDKLSVEFASELEGLNVRVTKLQDKVDKFDMKGTARIRYDHVKDRAVNTGTAGASDVVNQNMNIDFNYTYKINDEWSVKGESEWMRDLRSNGASLKTENDQFEQLYVTGPIGGTTVKAGRFKYTPSYGMTFDDKVAGAAVTFGNTLKTTVAVGNNANSEQHQAIDFVYAYNKNTNIKANYQNFKANANADNVKYIEVGFDTKLSPNFAFQAGYTKSDKDTNNKQYMAQIQYKAVDTNVVGSNDIYIQYRKFQSNSYSSMAGDWRTGGFTSFKGTRIGFDYVPMANTKFATWYQTGKTADDGDTKDVKFFRAQMEFMF